MNFNRLTRQKNKHLNDCFTSVSILFYDRFSYQDGIEVK